MPIFLWTLSFVSEVFEVAVKYSLRAVFQLRMRSHLQYTSTAWIELN